MVPLKFRILNFSLLFLAALLVLLAPLDQIDASSKSGTNKEDASKSGTQDVIYENSTYGDLARISKIMGVPSWRKYL
jgi:hypothetical protein